MNITVYLGSAYGNDPDFKTKINVSSTDSLPFSNVGNNMGVYFMYDDFNKNWFMKVRNPNLIIENS